MSGAGRLASLDRLRGLIMALMAIDHASAFIARRHASEFWAAAWTRHDSAAWFLTRFVTHLCAPGFFFLMGTGMAMLASSHRAAGWSEGRIARFLAKRALLLLAVNQFIENPAWVLGILSGRMDGAGESIPGSGGPPIFVFGVITGLALSILLASALMRFPDWAWWLAAAAVLFASAALTPGPENAAIPYPLPLRLLAIPGLTGIAVVIYPIVPWFGLTALGVLFGRSLERDRAGTLRSAPWIGLALVASALVLRAAGGLGNLRLPRDGSWIEFLNFIKYPPSLVFSLFMAGANLLLLWAVRGDWLAVLGQSPLFFYIAHLYLYAAIGAAFFRNGSSMAVMYAVWAAGLVPLWFACRRYRRFKLARPADSVWRFF